MNFVLYLKVQDDSVLEEESSWWESYSITEHVNHYMTVKKVSSKDAIKQTAIDRGQTKREVYQAYHVEQE